MRGVCKANLIDFTWRKLQLVVSLAVSDLADASAAEYFQLYFGDGLIDLVFDLSSDRAVLGEAILGCQEEAEAYCYIS